MQHTTPPLRRYPDISPKAYEHPADSAATAALGSIPHVDTFIGRLTEYKYERTIRQAFLGSGVQLGPEQLPDMWNTWRGVLDALGLPDDTDCYITSSPIANAMAIGARDPMVVINSGLLSLLDDEQLASVMAHEAAHILSGHVLYRTALQVILQLGHMAGLPLFARLPVRAIRSALLEWSRASELSCDRASALVVGDPLIVCRTMLTIASGLESRHLNLDAFMAQASAYEEWGSSYDKIKRFFMEIELTHDLPVRRVKEVMSWVQQGDWDRIMSGSYQRLGDPVQPRKQTEEAVTHYAEHFKDFFKSTTESATTTGKTVSDWIRKGTPKVP